MKGFRATSRGNTTRDVGGNPQVLCAQCTKSAKEGKENRKQRTKTTVVAATKIKMMGVVFVLKWGLN